MDLLVYNHKVQIKRLWKEIHRDAYQIGEINKKLGNFDPGLKYAYRQKMNRAGKLINALLEYNYPGKNEAETEYVENNKYQKIST